MQNSSFHTMRMYKIHSEVDSLWRSLCLLFGTLNSSTVFAQVRTWNFPALVKYLTPLNGLYFSPYISRRLTLRPVQGGVQEWRYNN